jgi:hypothetical protein
LSSSSLVTAVLGIVVRWQRGTHAGLEAQVRVVIIVHDVIIPCRVLFTVLVIT